MDCFPIIAGIQLTVDSSVRDAGILSFTQSNVHTPTRTDSDILGEWRTLGFKPLSDYFPGHRFHFLTA